MATLVGSRDLVGRVVLGDVSVSEQIIVGVGCLGGGGSLTGFVTVMWNVCAYVYISGLLLSCDLTLDPVQKYATLTSRSLT